MRALARLDRRLGAAVRRAADAAPGAPRLARVLASAMSPAFRLAVAGLIVNRPSRPAGVRALVAGAAAATAARIARDRLGRRRPGARTDGGFPSRHAAAAAAIAATAGRHDPRVRAALGAAACAGMLARVADAEHEPGDILAGAALGLIVADAVERAAPRGVG